MMMIKIMNFLLMLWSHIISGTKNRIQKKIDFHCIKCYPFFTPTYSHYKHHNDYHDNHFPKCFRFNSFILNHIIQKKDRRIFWMFEKKIQSNKKNRKFPKKMNGLTTL